MSKGRNIRKIPETTVASKPTLPLTRSSSKKSSPYIQGKQATSQKPPTSPTKGENTIKWLNKKLREAEDHIIKLREEKITSKEGIMKKYKECRLAIDNACAILSNAQSKMKRNASLLM
jgi:hypothetical protein